MKLYRYEVRRPSDPDDFAVEWCGTKEDATRLSRNATFPHRVDVVEIPDGKPGVLLLANIAHANREAVAQLFPMADVELPSVRAFRGRENRSCPGCGVTFRPKRTAAADQLCAVCQEQELLA